MLLTVRADAIQYPERFIFIQGRCQVHMSRVVQHWFLEHQEIEMMDWPNKGCGVNPNENIWGYHVNMWEPSEQRTSHALFEYTIREWETLRRKSQLVLKYCT